MYIMMYLIENKATATVFHINRATLFILLHFLCLSFCRKRRAGDSSRRGKVSKIILMQLALTRTHPNVKRSESVNTSASYNGRPLSPQTGDSERVPAHRRRVQSVRQSGQRQRVRQLIRRRARPHLGHPRAAEYR